MTYGGIKQMGGVPTFTGVGTANARVAQAPQSTSGVGALLNLAGKVAKVYAHGQLTQQADKIQKEQTTAGQQHGLDAVKGRTSFSLRPDSDTVGGEAFNRAAQQSYITSIGLDIRDAASRFKTNHAADPSGFDHTYDQYAQGLLDKAPIELKPQIELELKARKLESLGQIRPQFEAKQNAQHRATVLTGLEAFGHDYENAWRRGDVTSAQGAMVRYSQSLQAAIQNELIAPEDGAKMVMNLQEEGAKHTVIGEFERAVETSGLEAGDVYIKAFKKSKTQIDPDLKDRIVARLESDVAGLKADQRVRETELAKKTQDVVSVIEKGYEPQGLEGLRNEVKGTKWETELDAAMADRDYIQAFAKQPPEVQDTVLAQLQEKKQNPRSASLLSRLENTASHARTALENDPMGHAIDVGAVNAPSSIDLSAAPEELMAAAQQRNRAAQKIEEIYKVPTLPLTDREMGQLEGLLQTGNAQSKTQILGTLTQGFGEKNVREIARKLAPKQPAFAMAAMLSNEDPATAKQILIGEEVLAADPKLKPSRTDWVMASQDYFEDALAHSPADQGRAVEAALSIYAAEIQVEGKPTEAFDSDRFTRALDRVTGGIVEWNDQKIFPPIRGMKQGDFDKFMDSLSADDLMRFSVGGAAPTWRGGQNLDLDALIDHGELTPIAPGQYRVTIQGRDIQGSGPNGIYVMRFDEPTVLARLGRARPTEVAGKK